MCLVPTVLFMTDNFTFEDEDKSTIARLIDIDKVHDSLSLYNQIVVSALGMYSIRIYPFYMSWLSFSCAIRLILYRFYVVFSLFLNSFFVGGCALRRYTIYCSAWNKKA